MQIALSLFLPLVCHSSCFPFGHYHHQHPLGGYYYGEAIVKQTLSIRKQIQKANRKRSQNRVMWMSRLRSKANWQFASTQATNESSSTQKSHLKDSQPKNCIIWGVPQCANLIIIVRIFLILSPGEWRFCGQRVDRASLDLARSNELWSRPDAVRLTQFVVNAPFDHGLTGSFALLFPQLAALIYCECMDSRSIFSIGSCKFA